MSAAPASGWRRRANDAAPWLLVASCAAVPLPAAFISITTGMFLVALVLSGGYSQRWQRLRADPLALRALILFAAMAVSVLWSPAPWRAAIDSWWHYRALLLLALGLAIVDDGLWCRRGYFAFAAAFSFALVVSYLRRFGVLPLYNNGGYYAGFVGHAGFSLMLGIGAFTMLWLAFLPGRWRAAWFAVGLAALANLYLVNDGRSGQVTFLLLLPWIAVQRLKLRGLAIGVAAAGALLTGAYLASPTFQHRIDAIGRGVQSYEQGRAEATEEGLRLSFWRHRLELVRAHPVFGDGAGSFIVDYSELAGREQLQGQFVTHNPHNDYLMIGVQQGFFGLLLLAWLLVTQWRQAATTGTSGIFMRALMILCCFAALVTSVFLDQFESHMYALLAIAFSRPWAPSA